MSENRVRIFRRSNAVGVASCKQNASEGEFLSAEARAVIDAEFKDIACNNKLILLKQFVYGICRWVKR